MRKPGDGAGEVNGSGEGMNLCQWPVDPPRRAASAVPARRVSGEEAAVRCGRPVVAGLPYRTPYCARHGRRAFQDLAGWQRRNADVLSPRRLSVDPLDIRHVLDGVEELPE